jgi:hypothetical protein
MDDIAVNDPKMNSMFSIDLIKSGDSFINNTLSDLEKRFRTDKDG